MKDMCMRSPHRLLDHRFYVRQRGLVLEGRETRLVHDGVDLCLCFPCACRVEQQRHYMHEAFRDTGQYICYRVRACSNDKELYVRSKTSNAAVTYESFLSYSIHIQIKERKKENSTYGGYTSRE